MGLVDSFAAEDRVEVKYSDFYKLVRAEAERALLKNAVFAGVPREQILKMLSGQNDELEEYRKTGLSPDQIREMDKFYAEKCKEVAITTAEKDVLKKQIEDLMVQREAEEAAAADAAVQDEAEAADAAVQDEAEAADGGEATQAETETEITADPDKKKRSGKRNIDRGKILALKKAGWKVKDIAEDMGLEASTVSQVLWQENRKAKQAGKDENALL